MENLYFTDKKEARKYFLKRLRRNISLYLTLLFFALFTVLPFYWMIVTALKTDAELQLANATFFPRQISMEAFKTVFSGSNSVIFRYMLNTIIVGISTTAISIFVTIFSAFAFSRLSFRGRDFLFAVLLSTMMIPGEMLIITNFTTVSLMGWLNTYTALIIPFTASVFYTFFLRQTFKQIPDELYYAAKVDGNSDFKYLFKVMIPIAKPTIITIVILSVIGSWNAYIWPRTVSDGREMKLITDGLMYLFRDSSTVQPDNLIMSATLLVSIPLFLAFLLFKKHIMRGVSRSGIKG